MAEEADEHGNIADERSQILQLQSEQFRKQEQLDRLRQRCKALDDELQQREAELSDVQRKCNEERNQGRTRNEKGEERARAALAEDEFLRHEVQKILQSRVPAMAPLREEGEDESNLLEKNSAPKQEEATKQVHDTVLVSYVQSQDGRQEDFKVSYRISSQTTVEQLHRDACAYWGCSRKDYTLFKIADDDQPKPLFPRPGERMEQKALQDVDILNPAEAAHLHLCRDSDDLKKARQKERDRERKEGERTAQPAQQEGPQQEKSHDVLKTLKHGLGYATNEKQPDEFVDAFRSWPGIHHMLATRDRTAQGRMKWHPVFFSDFLAYIFLILLSAICIGYRNETDFFLLREGVYRTLVEGIPGETFEESEIHWLSLKRGHSASTRSVIELSPGITFSGTGARINGSLPGVHFARSLQGVPQEARAVTMIGVWVPPAGACGELGIMIAAGTRPPAAAAPRVSIAWSCTNVTVVGANGTESVSASPLCASFGSGGGHASVTFGRNGSINFSAGNGCHVTLPAGSAGNWSMLGRADPLFVFLSGEGGGELSSISIIGRVPAPVLQFVNVTTFPELRTWLGGGFSYQLFNPYSTLQRHYNLISSVYIRQQVAKSKPCPRDQVPFNLQRRCHEVEVNSETEDKKMLPPAPGSSILPPSTRIWRSAPRGDAGFFGEVQRYYSGSGYTYEIPLANVTMAAFPQVALIAGTAITNAWLTTATRLVSMEMLLENKDVGGHVVVNLFCEISPGGALNPVVTLLPVRLAASYGSDVAKGLDIARWVVVLVMLVGVRVWRETKRQVLLGYSGLAYVLSLEGIVDAITIASFFALQYMRLNGQPKLPLPTTTFRSYSQAAYDQHHLAILEAWLLLLLIVRFSTFMRFSPHVFRFFKSFSRAMRMFAFYLLMFVPVFLCNAFLANAIFGPYLENASTFLRSFYTLVFAMKESYNVERLVVHTNWAFPFLTYFWLSTVAFFLYGFLAIAVHAYFEVQLMEGSDPNAESWSFDDWLQWMLWRPVLRWATRGADGEKKRDAEEGGDQDEEEESSDEEEHEEKRG